MIRRPSFLLAFVLLCLFVAPFARGGAACAPPLILAGADARGRVTFAMGKETALIVVDVQPDFCPGGPLGVCEGDALVPLINAARADYPFVAFAQDWHPPGHGSFATSHSGKKVGDFVEVAGIQQMLWPDHCVQGTPGAELCSGLVVRPGDIVVQKGTAMDLDSMSGFFDNAHRRQTDLHALLQERGVREVHVCGLATDYCVKFTVLDALRLGYRVVVRAELSRGVNLVPGDVERSLQEMERAGARVTLAP